MNEDLETMIEKCDNIPDVILVRKKYIKKKGKRNWKLRHLNKDKDYSKSDKKNIKDQDEYEEQYEEFLRDVEENKELRNNINIYKDEDALKINEEDLEEDPHNTIKVDELLDNINLEDSEAEEKFPTNKADHIENSQHN